VADYDLAGLSTRSFEQLIQSLAAAVMGPGIIVFGDGPDGAREAVYQGAVSYGTNKTWDGYLVLQAKFLQKPTGTKADGSWLLQQLSGELPKFLDNKRRLKKPEYYIIATNVALSAVAGKGTKDKVYKLLEDYQKKIGYKGFDVWDSDKIRVFLDQHRGIATAYSAWITSGDVLRKLMDAVQDAAPGFDDTLANFLKKELLSSQYANLEQAGHTTEHQVPLAGVFIDLPVSKKQLYEPDDAARGFTSEIAEVAREIFRLDQGKALDTTDRKIGRYVLIGGPGQGKTTLGQYICQLFRAAILTNLFGTSTTGSISARGRTGSGLLRKCASLGQDRARVGETRQTESVWASGHPRPERYANQIDDAVVELFRLARQVNAEYGGWEAQVITSKN
jgi:hypothetical protein